MSPRERLKSWRKSHKYSVVRLADELECSRQMVYAIEAGTKIPGNDLGNRIAKLCRIANEAWDQPLRFRQRSSAA